ncbi:kinesin-like protein KIF15 [Ostrea edulis]|uniref:kinesin-like protein KIF15 n=1 Tax=Ostrea edulis TaxID=37623 RepID=UPI0024AEE560|nr:kinesin-like protein KIF15 [Ostrea edulis]
MTAEWYLFKFCSEGDAIKVFVRIRPPDSYDNDRGCQQCVSVNDTKTAVIIHSKPDPKTFTFDHVVDHQDTQESVFTIMGKKIIESCIAGYNGTIFAYGQTGSGKTYSMIGPSDDVENFQHVHRGVTPRSFEYLFNLISEQQENGAEFLLKCSFLEIYNEQIYDLMEPSTMTLHLRENMKKGVFVDRLTEVSVTSALEAYEVLTSGWINRRVASTSMNRESSRSHAVFTIQIESKQPQGKGVKNLKESQLNLVDLAGSERQKDTNAVGQRLKEAGSINRSLSILGNVIMSLVDIAHGKSRHIPYRDSRLTFLLRDSLGGNAKTHIIACIHPGSKSFGETLSTLHFARRAKLIKNKAVVNEDTQGNVLSLQQEIKRLKEQLAAFVSGNHAVQSVTAPSSMTDSEWKERFVRCMLFKDKADQQNQILQQRIEQLQDLCNKMDKCLQSSKMIVKFRDNNISRLEKIVKDKHDVQPVLQQTIEDLRGEIDTLKYQIEHNPHVSKYVADIQHLKNELKQLRSQRTDSHEVDNRKMEQLEQLYKQLVEEQKGEGNIGTPKHTPSAAENVSKATVEKYKSQLEKLTEENEELKEKMKQTQDVWEKKDMEQQSELASVRKAYADLKFVLESYQIRTQVEHDVIKERHLQVVKTITTPKKVVKKLRNREICAPYSNSSTPILNDTIPFEENEGIFEQCEPEVMTEEHHAGLIEEIKQLQDQNSSLNQRIVDMETETVQLRQHISKVDHQNAKLTEILERERSSVSETTEKLNKLSKKLSQELEEENIKSLTFESENKDLKIILQQTEKELEDYKTMYKSQENTLRSQVGEFKDKLGALGLETEKIQKINEEIVEEKQNLQETLATVQETLDYRECQIQELEVAIADLQKQKQDIQVQMQENLNQSDINLKDKNKLFNELETTKHEMISLKEAVGKKDEDLNAVTAEIQRLEKINAENQEALSTFMKKIEDKNMEIASMKYSLDMQVQKDEELQGCVDEKEGRICELEIRNSLLVKESDSKADKISSLQEELDQALENLHSFTLEHEKIEKEVVALKNLLEAKDKELTSLHGENSNLALELSSTKTEQCKEVIAQQACVIEEYKEQLNLLKNSEMSVHQVSEEMDRVMRHSPLAHRLICREKRVHDADRENLSPWKKFVSPVMRLTTGSEQSKCKLFSSNSAENRVSSPNRKPVLSEILCNRSDRVSEDLTDDSQMDLDQAFVKTDSMQAYVYKSPQGESNAV